MDTVDRSPSVQRALRAISLYDVPDDRIDQAILAAINATLCLLSDGDDRVAEGFNRDIALNGTKSAAFDEGWFS